MTLSAAEQLMLELVNRARLDPEGEAARFGIDLNDDLAPDTLDGTAKQVLAPNVLLENAAEGHSQWMLANDTFSHQGAGNSSSHQRMVNAGYTFSGPSYASGENIALAGTTGTINLNTAIVSQHEGLFKSSGHRENILNGFFRELGIAQVRGDFTDEDNVTFDTSMVTQNFARSGTSVFLTGVVYTDSDSDDFYSIGEGTSGTAVSAQSQAGNSASAGGYALSLTAASGVAATLGGTSFTIDLSGGNAKVDLVDGNRLFSSADIEAVSGISELRLLGVADIDATGTAGAETLIGNSGKNELRSGDGDDTIEGLGGNDLIFAGEGLDRIFGGLGNDNIRGENGDDTIIAGDGNDVVRGGHHRDSIEGGAGDDRLLGGKARDRIEGQDGNDDINGDKGKDNIFGGKGHDFIQGGVGNDTISGGRGNDTLNGGEDNDIIRGDIGADRLVFEAGGGLDQFTDFEDDIDVLLLNENLWGGGSKSAAQIIADHASVVNGDAVFDFGSGDVLTVNGVTDLNDFLDDIA